MEQYQNDDEIELRAYIEVICRRWKTILLITLFFAFTAFFYSLILKPVYESKTMVLIKSAGVSSSSQYAALMGMMGINLTGNGGSMGDLIGLLRSRVVAAKVFDLLDLEKSSYKNVKKEAMISVIQGMLLEPKVNGGIVEIKIQAQDPQIACNVANTYVDALSFYWNELNNTEARRKLNYIQTELPRVENNLRAVENKLKLVPRTSVGFSVSGQSSLQRDYEIYSSVYTMLRKEYESAKLEISKEIPPFSVVDPALKPKLPVKPKKTLNTMIGLVLGLFSGILIAFFQEYWQKSGEKK